MREQVLRDIEESIFAIDIDLLHIKDKDDFTQLSFEKWALMEMQELIREKSNISPVAVVNEFMNRMEQYAMERHPNSYVFCIAVDTAYSVLSEIIGGYSPS